MSYSIENNYYWEDARFKLFINSNTLRLRIVSCKIMAPLKHGCCNFSLCVCFKWIVVPYLPLLTRKIDRCDLMSLKMLLRVSCFVRERSDCAIIAFPNLAVLDNRSSDFQKSKNIELLSISF